MGHESPASILPGHLAERTRIISGHPVRANAKYVLYWMHHAARGHENPALEVAVTVANWLNLPVLVYQGLAGHHPYNSDRHHTFILEGARDTARELAERDIRHVFYLARTPSQQSPLQQLASAAALIIAEDYPAPPFPKWTRSLAASLDCPLWAVDASCIVPMQSLGRSYERAFQFRSKTRAEFDARVGQTWAEVQPVHPPFAGEVGCPVVDFDRSDIADLVASCEIDHSVGPVPETPGGSFAGYRRWETFRVHGLAGYARTRNDPTILPPRGVSRLSPYLHHGHVSVFKIAREAAASGIAGAEKYLDELLIWRELAFNLCHYAEDVSTIEALPEWARQTLIAHVSDQRVHLYSWETLARGSTGNLLWDTAQKSLLAHGELHNNVRMTWGKALLQWTRSPQQALDMLLDLNHRYALDGSDPNSYGGLLWCLGLFDRPFKPETSVFGTVRARSLDAHASRLDVEKYASYVTRPTRDADLSVAVVGAGLSGLMAARVLRDHNINVQVFDKARGSGGRMATRRNNGRSFDHGAQYFTVRDERFRRYVDSWLQDGLVDLWQGEIGVAENGAVRPKSVRTRRFVGTPRMSAITRYLSADLPIRYQTRISRCNGRDHGWELFEEDGSLGRFDCLLLAIPPEQAVELLGTASDIHHILQDVQMQPCWAVMAAFEDRLELDEDGIFFDGIQLSWAARNSSKPGRPTQESWILHGSPEWSTVHLEERPSSIAENLLARFFADTGCAPSIPSVIQAHRWRYALAANPLDSGVIWDDERRIGACGDWCMGSRIEGAFLSGMAAAGRILGAFGMSTQELEAQGSLFPS